MRTLILLSRNPRDDVRKRGQRKVRITGADRRRIEAHVEIRASEAADVLWACSSPELYELLVDRRGWPLARYARFITDVMVAGLLAKRT